MDATAMDEHRWLERFVGEWTWEMEADGEPGQPGHRLTGTERVRSLGGVWVVCEGEGAMPDGGQAQTIMTLGFDSSTGRFTGTFVGTMMHHLWLYDGEIDREGSVLTLDTEGPGFEDPSKLSRYRDTITFHGDDHRVLASSYQGADGTWHEFMASHYRRAA